MKRLICIMCCLAGIACLADSEHEKVDKSRHEERRQLDELQREMRKSRLSKSADSGDSPFVRKRKVELTEAEAAFDLESFAGFKFGEAASSSELYHYRAKGFILQNPIRAFTRVQVGYTSINPRLCSVHIWGSVKDWDAQSITEEIEAVGNFLSSRYGVPSWMSRGDFRLRFENENISISVCREGHFLALNVISRRMINADRQGAASALKPVSFASDEGFAELAQLAESTKVAVCSKIKATIPSGEYGDTGLSEADSTVWESSEAGGSEQIIFLPCRSESGGNRGRVYWRPFVISPDGRIRKIDKEQESETSSYYSNV